MNQHRHVSVPAPRGVRRTYRILCGAAVALLLAGLVSSTALSARGARLVRDIDRTRSPHLPPACPLSPCPLPEPFYGSVLTHLMPYGDRIVFSADDGLTGLEPWISDGTEAGTYRLADRAPGAEGSSPAFIGSSPARAILWTALPGSLESSTLFSTQGEAGDLLPIPLPCGNQCDPELENQAPTLAYEGGLLFWVRDLELRHRQLFLTDGTAAGTRLVKDLCDTSESCNRYPRKMISWRDGIVFSESAFGDPGRLWYLEAGSSIPERILEDCKFFGNMIEWQDQLLISASCANSPIGLYTVAEPTGVPVLLHSLEFGQVLDYVPLPSGTFFSVRHDAAHNLDQRIWFTDGTPAGTTVRARFSNIYSIGAFESDLVMAAKALDGPHVTLWRLAASGEPQLLTDARVTTDLRIAQDQVYFGAHHPNYGVELWSSDGSPSGTQMLADINPGPASSNPTDGGVGFSGFVASGGNLYFAADHPDYDIELWTIPLGTSPEPLLCSTTADSLCLENRFRITADWTDHAGDQGSGQVVPLATDTGAFWFFDEGNLELMVKVLDACESEWNSFWVFAGGLTDVGVDLRIEDLAAGVTREYGNSLGERFQPIQDTAAFRTCEANGN